MKRVILYARVATMDQAVGHQHKLQQQVDALIKYCNDKNIEIEVCFREIASGATFDRRIFNQMLLNTERGHIKADTLLFTTWDRFSRNLPAALDMIKTLRKLGIKVKSIQEPDTAEIENLLKQVLKRSRNL